MNPTIKAIETHYKGYRFRSRLEARWAVFFDALGVKWEYEPQGFALKGVGAYLPDFWMPQVHMWAEVKPVPFTSQERDKCRALVHESGFSCLLLVGTPEAKAYEAEQGYGDENCVVTYALTNYHGYVVDEGRFFSCPDDESYPDTVAAINVARAARFEFGR